MSNAVKKTEPTKTAAAAPAPTHEAVKGKLSLLARIADRYAVEPDKMKQTLIDTAFRQKPKKDQAVVPITDAQMMMLLVVADEYHLNPFTREIYAFPSENGIVAIVSVDGWIRIINERPELKSIEFSYAPTGTAPEDAWIGCIIERHDRAKPIEIREYLSECMRDTGPWREMPKRMLRHKALIQCARVAFGFGGIYDPEEAARIMEERVVSVQETRGKPLTRPPQVKLPQQTPAPASTPVATITLDQSTALADKIKEEGVDLSAVLAPFEIGSLDQLPAEHYDAALELIDELTTNAG